MAFCQGVDTYSSIFDSAKEKRAFQFFKERTSPRITGLSEFEFWYLALGTTHQ